MRMCWGKRYLLFDEHLIDSYTRDDEVGIRLGDMVPDTHFVDDDSIDVVGGVEVTYMIFSKIVML
jgi:hypothetical protein